jgi:hypothetical protein
MKIQRVDGRCVDLHQDLTVPDARFLDVAQFERAGQAVGNLHDGFQGTTRPVTSES